MKVFFKQKTPPSLVNMVVSVNIGSKNESGETSGFVHLLEHLILYSENTTLSPTHGILNLREKGGYLNAHTDHDLMTFELSLPAHQVKFGLVFLMEKIFNLTASEDDLNREKQIIAEEINQLTDHPKSRGTKLAFQALFGGHPYEMPLYGNPEIIAGTTLSHLLPFYNRYFSTDNCALSVVGDISPPLLESAVKEVFGSLKPVTTPVPPIPEPAVPRRNSEFTIEMDVRQAMLLIGFRAPAFDNRDKFAFDILNHILGKGANPLLGMAYRARKDLAAGFTTRYIPLLRGGIFLIYLRTDPGKIHLLKRETMTFLNKTNTFRYSKSDFLKKDQIYVTDYLESARNQIKLNSEQSKEKGLSSAISFARYMLLTDNSRSFNYRREMDAVGSADLRKIASKYICGEPHAIVYILPKKDEP